MEEKSIVDLWDLPDDRVYLRIKEKARHEFFTSIKTKYG